MRKQHIVLAFFSVVIPAILLTGCASKLERAKAEILFDNIASHIETPTDSTKDSISLAIESYDLSQLDSNYQKAFFFNCYNFILNDYIAHQEYKLDLKNFLSQKKIISRKSYTTKSLIDKIRSYKDERLLLCLDFGTTTSTKTSHKTLHKDINKNLDRMCREVLSDEKLIRVKKEVFNIYYPEQYNWLIGSNDEVKKTLLKFIENNKELENYRLKPYPFSKKLRN